MIALKYSKEIRDRRIVLNRKRRLLIYIFATYLIEDKLDKSINSFFVFT